MNREVWLEGPLEGVPPLLMPVAHALIQAGHDVREAIDGLTLKQLWLEPGGAASIGFHLRHMAGSTDRLVAYALGRSLDPGQVARLKEEKTVPPESPPAEDLLQQFDGIVAQSLEVLRATPDSGLLDRRLVGRAGRPSTVLGLLYHAGEHAQRHAGQVITTAKVVRGSA